MSKKQPQNTETAASHTLIHDLRTLLSDEFAGSQHDLVSAMKDLGHDVNQSKISRLLRKLDATKAKNAQGEVVYRLAKEPAPPTTQSALGQLIINIAANEHMIVIHTSPGSASLIARLLDYQQKQAGILGTVAGDDTILVIPTSVKDLKNTLQQIQARLSTL